MQTLVAEMELLFTSPPEAISFMAWNPADGLRNVRSSYAATGHNASEKVFWINPFARHGLPTPAQGPDTRQNDAP